MLSNNDILKKLRVALSLKNDDIIEILALTDFKITKGALGDLFRHPDHEGYADKTSDCRDPRVPAFVFSSQAIEVREA